jgi:chorismate mutase/prephenate dehydratase
LNNLRDKIDDIDNKLVELINERMEYVQNIGDLKNKNNESIYRPQREKDILDRLHKREKNLLKNSDIDAIFMEIFSISRNLELPQKVAYLGPRGSFTHQAAKSRFGLQSEYISSKSIKDVFEVVNLGIVKFGVVPIENSSNGIVGETISAFAKSNVFIISEVICNISHCLASKQDNLKNIKKIYSKDIAFWQCSSFLEGYDFKNIDLIYVESTAKAADLASKEDDSAAICSEVAANMYSLPILYNNIQTTNNNKTRFFVISNYHNQKLTNAKTSILATLPNSPGALVDFLLEFNKYKINLIKIKSHINNGISSFFIDFDGDKNEDNISKIVSQENIKLLGSYIKESDDV